MIRQIIDGYEWIETFDKNFLRKNKLLRTILGFYFKPFKIEFYKSGLIYRRIGVHVFGKYLPTGGFEIRRITKRKMQAYTLKYKNLNAAKEFLYKSCFFETLHMPFFLFLLLRSIWWYTEHSNIQLAFELMVVNLVFNIYPIMHQRYTRVRILKLIKKYSKQHIIRNQIDI